jgi:exosortase D (VPLPA-CTERM-specific)
MYRLPIYGWILLGLAGAAALLTFRDGAAYMWQVWQANEEYSHVYLIPFVSAFMVWQRRQELAQIEFQGSWTGVLVVLLGIATGVLGNLAAVYTLQQVGLVVAIWGLVLALTGWRVVRLLWMPLLLLILVIPLPRFVQVNLSANMQLWSSALGVWFIRLMGISVYLEGNVIDLGVYKLQVVEACDGLRYLFPLLTLGLIMAYFYQGALWKRVVIVLSSIPITLVMNSFRIAMIGWLVENWGVRMAEGFVHDFQGWAVFMASLALMVVLMIVLSRFGADRKPWRELFAIDFPPEWPSGTRFRPRALPRTSVAAAVLLLGTAVVSVAMPTRTEQVPPRAEFLDFPMVIGPWLGERGTVPPEAIEALQFDDYLVADFRGPPTASSVGLYVAWYDSQQSGRSIHSPRTCLPGGGWQVESFEQVTLPASAAGQPLRVNRALLALGGDRQLVYYWFQQRGRIITNEYLAKWYLFWDSLTRKRSDGALVRLSVPLPPGAAPEQGDKILVDFADTLEPVLDKYVPR